MDKEKLGFEDLIKGLLLLVQQNYMTKELMYHIVTNVISNNYYVGMDSEFIVRYLNKKTLEQKEEG